MGSMLGVLLGVPPEANPEIVNDMLENFGVSKRVRVLQLGDMSEAAVKVIPKPVYAVIAVLSGKATILVFRLTRKTAGTTRQTDSSKLYFLKVSSPKMTGIAAVVHCVANNMRRLTVHEGPLKRFIDQTQAQPPEMRGEYLRKSHDIMNVHRAILQAFILPRPGGENTEDVREMTGRISNWLDVDTDLSDMEHEISSLTDAPGSPGNNQSALPGQKNPPPPSPSETGREEASKSTTAATDDTVTTSFVVFVVESNILFELDACHNEPICHGECPLEELLERSAMIVQEYKRHAPEEIRAVMMAMTCCGCLNEKEKT